MNSQRHMRANKRIKTIASFLSASTIILSCLFCACSHSHSLEFVKGRNPTCSEKGLTEHWHCTGCGKNFTDDKASEQLDAVVIPFANHVFDGYGWDSEGHYKKCGVCGYADESTRTNHILYFEANDDVHYRVCYCGYKTPEEQHMPDGDGEGFCSVCRFRRPRFELSEDGEYYICTGASKAFKDLVTELVIPDTYMGLPVREIGERAFDSCPELESVTLGANVITLGGYAFKDCKKLKHIALNDNLLEIQRSAFFQCTALQNIVLPSKLIVMENGIFQGCTALESVNIPSGITAISNNTFYGCSSLKNIALHDGIVSFSMAVFSESGLTEFTVPKNVTAIPQTMFYKCPDLQSVVIPSSVKSIGPGAFMDCASLETIYFKGTEEQWMSIEFGDIWDKNSDFTVVYLG